MGAFTALAFRIASSTYSCCHIHPGSMPRADALARLTEALRSIGSVDPPGNAVTELPAAAASYAAALRRAGLPPEAMVISIKDLFLRMDGQRPSLSGHDSEELHAHSPPPLYGHWYPTVFHSGVEGYYGAN
jgi:hypothetical protein